MSFLEIAACFIPSEWLLLGSSVSKQQIKQVTKWRPGLVSVGPSMIQRKVLQGTVNSAHRLYGNSPLGYTISLFSIF